MCARVCVVCLRRARVGREVLLPNTKRETTHAAAAAAAAPAVRQSPAVPQPPRTRALARRQDSLSRHTPPREAPTPRSRAAARGKAPSHTPRALACPGKATRPPLSPPSSYAFSWSSCPARDVCPISTGRGTRRVRLVRGEGRGVSDQYGVPFQGFETVASFIRSEGQFSWSRGSSTCTHGGGSDSGRGYGTGERQVEGGWRGCTSPCHLLPLSGVTATTPSPPARAPPPPSASAPAGSAGGCAGTAAIRLGTLKGRDVPN